MKTAAPTAATLDVTIAAPASFRTRLTALFLDSLVLTGANLTVLGIALVATQSDYATLEGFLQLLGALGGWLYYAVLESSDRQATFGKQWMGIRVTDLHGQRISFRRATVRFFGRLVSTIPVGIGFLFVFWSKRRQALHDMMAGCVVVREVPVAVSPALVAGVPVASPRPKAIAVTFLWATVVVVLGLTVWLGQSVRRTEATAAPQAAPDVYKQWLAELRPAKPASPPTHVDIAADFERWRAERKTVIGHIERVQPVVAFDLSLDFPDSDELYDRTLETHAQRTLVAAGITVLNGQEPSQPGDAQLRLRIRRWRSGANTTLLVEASVRHPDIERHMDVWTSSGSTATSGPSEVEAKLNDLIAQATYEFAKTWTESRRD